MLVDPHHPFFRPLWVRVLCVLLPLLWAGFEASTGAIFWAILFGAAGLYLFVALFVTRREDDGP
ncbi:hypothetical protein SAMN04487972_11073 [Paracoccus halophilus]|uniref:DUF3329 domain-containing protein n=1 Tax=Paracoccus halophilus TaxID=376733 RepID=A0A099EYW2_9RHOB|nr:hypothetical protein [Paracoccus halophilus]KGJ03097.1 hypothetical protein IT41_15410 [Paracoccus halophilus]SFA53038.1 hypothetical protein SAMN04487972_11073 [Paracoccus halophilus]